MRNFLIIGLVSIACNCFAQINTFYVAPNETDAEYIAEQDSHLVVRNTDTNNNRLFLFIGGTGSTTKNYLRISEFAGNLGFDVINISYVNDVAAASLKNSSDVLEFDHYRQEICYGTPISPAVEVDSFNSIQTRTIKLLNYLDSTYPSESWDQYLLDPNTLDWSKIAIGGHSQGGGHAPYFAKYQYVDRVLMFSSPNDYSDYFAKPANWLRISGVTPVNRHFAYLSLLDEIVDFDKQLSNIQDLGIYPLYDTIHVDNATPPFADSRCLYTTQNPGLAILHHNSPVKFSFKNNSVWEYMLTTDVTSKVNEQPFDLRASIYPNPTNSDITIQFNVELPYEKYYIRNVCGYTVITGRTTNSKMLNVDLSSFERGIYFLSVGGQTYEIVKK